MKKYVLASAEAQKNVNLNDYGDTIGNAIFDIVHEDDMIVTTCNDCYYMDLERPLTDAEEAAIEEILWDSELSVFATRDGVIFTSIEVDCEELYPTAVQ